MSPSSSSSSMLGLSSCIQCTISAFCLLDKATFLGGPRISQLHSVAEELMVDSPEPRETLSVLHPFALFSL